MRQLACLLALACLAGCYRVELSNHTIRCSSDGKCPRGEHCAGDNFCYRNGQDPPPDLGVGTGSNGDGGAGLTVGLACSGDADCALGHCVDGVCCNMACDGPCVSCNQPDNAGQCLPIGAGVAARGTACGPDAATSCGHNGLCDGNGACQFYDATTHCAAGSCSAATNTVIGDSSCDGAGHCTAPAPITCAPFKCDAAGKACIATCTGNADCTAPNICTMGSCGQRELGSACSANGDCKSGHCVGLPTAGICCDDACTGSCKACNAAGHCLPTTAGQPDPKKLCTNDTTKCTVATCDGKGACTATAKNTVCSLTCANGAVTHGQYGTATYTKLVCDGVTSGSCTQRDTTKTSCGANICSSATACKASCTVDADCAATSYCAAGVCTLRNALKAACTANNQCTSQLCDPKLGKCTQCLTQSDAYVDYQHCKPTAPTCNTDGSCGACTTYINDNQTFAMCTGWGNYTPGTLCDSKGACNCTQNSDCQVGQGPFCVAGKCGCTTAGAWCDWGSVCTTARVCKQAMGFPCLTAADCASNVCNNGVCSQPNTPVLPPYCSQSADCPLPNSGPDCHYECHPGDYTGCQNVGC